MISEAITTPRRPTAVNGALRTPLVDIVVPVYNEQAGLERSIRRLHSVPVVEHAVRLADRDRRQRQHRRDARDRPIARRSSFPDTRAPPARQGPRSRAAHGVVAERRGRPLLHGRRPLDRPAGAAAAGRGARLRPQRRRDRDPPSPRLARCARSQARVHLPRLQPLLRLALGARFSDAQCGFKAIRADVAAMLLPAVAGRRLVLRYGAARSRAAPRTADPRGPGRLGRRSGFARRHHLDGARRPARRRRACSSRRRWRGS